VVTRLKACLNGGRRRDEHPAVPITPAELARAARAAVAAGAEAVHLHPRGPGGRESLEAGDVAAAVTAVRAVGPTIPVGVSTGLWISGGDVGRRWNQVAAWAELDPVGRPDFASVNLSEPGSAELAEALHAGGIGVEAGVWSVADVPAVVGIDGLVRILVEVIDAPAEAAAGRADEILVRLDGIASGVPRLLHGEGPACWPLVAHAGRLGLPTRIGLEDTLVGPDGGPVADNAELVRLALSTWDTGTVRP
jgi:uncharacterized protein (DUF849 family)